MQKNPNDKKKLYIFIAAGVLVLIVLSFLITFLSRDSGENQYGKRIRIQNYTGVQKTPPTELRDTTESFLYTVTQLNNSETLNSAKISDAVIRSDSSTSEYSDKTATLDGEYIVDIASLKQSYRVQFSYSNQVMNTNTSSSPVIVSCLPINKLKYGDFKCTDLMAQESGVNSAILPYLPYQNYSFKIVPLVESGKITLNVTLTIPAIDLKGDISSRQEVVSLYKNEVLKWIRSKDDDPSNYTIVYNYDDNGNLK